MAVDAGTIMNNIRIFNEIIFEQDLDVTYGVILTKNSHFLPDTEWLTFSEWDWLNDKSPKRQQNFAWGRAAVRWLCSQLAGVARDEVLISLPSSKEPEVWINRNRFYCSISHSHSKIVILVNQTQRVAVDIEWCRTDRSFAHYQEVFPELQPYCSEPEAFYHRWTLLETAAKYNSIPLLDLLGGQELPTHIEVQYLYEQEYLICTAPAQIPIRWYRFEIP